MEEQTPPRRSSRQRTPAAPYTPSQENNATQRNFTMCRKKAAKKTQKACNRENVLYEINKHGNIILVFQPAAYRFYYEALNQQIQEMKENQAYNIETNPSVDGNGEEVDKNFKIHINRKKTCTINCYHTTYKMMINGRTLTYTGTIHPTVCTQMQTQNISDENQRILDRITSEITNREVEQREREEIPNEGAVGAVVGAVVTPTENNNNDRQNQDIVPTNRDRQADRTSRHDINDEYTDQTLQQEDETSLKSIDNRASMTELLTQEEAAQENTNGTNANYDTTYEKTQIEQPGTEPITSPIASINEQSWEDETSLKELNNQIEVQVHEPRRHKKDKRLIIPTNTTNLHISRNTSIHNDLLESRSRTEEVDEQKTPLLCPVCNRLAEIGTIECSKCNSWLHYECENVEQEDSSNAEYICSLCFLDEHQQQQNNILSMPRQEQQNQTRAKQQAVQKSNDTNKSTKTKQNTKQKNRQSQQHNCTEAERKIAMMQAEIARLEDIVKEQKDTIRIYKIRAAAYDTQQNQTAKEKCSQHSEHGEIESINKRITALEIENLKIRLNAVEEKLHHATSKPNDTLQGPSTDPTQETGVGMGFQATPTTTAATRMDKVNRQRTIETDIGPQMNRSMYNGNKTHLRLNKEMMLQLPHLTPALFPIQSYKPGMLGIPQANTTRFLPVQNFQQGLPTTRREIHPLKHRKQNVMHAGTQQTINMYQR